MRSLVSEFYGLSCIFGISIFLSSFFSGVSYGGAERLKGSEKKDFFYIDLKAGLLPIPTYMVVKATAPNVPGIFVSSPTRYNKETWSLDWPTKNTRIEIQYVAGKIDPIEPFNPNIKFVQVEKIDKIDIYRFRLVPSEHTYPALEEFCFDRALIGSFDVQISSEDCQFSRTIMGEFKHD